MLQMPYYWGMAIDIFTIQQDLHDYADYDTTNSVSRCKSYIVAARRWLDFVAGSSSNQSSSMTYNVAQTQENLNRAISWLAANDRTTNTNGPGSVRFLGAGSCFR